ncbi:MAG TPA: Ig-like domain-containing protein [Candidatus Dormibacteraeota bacterium]
MTVFRRAALIIPALLIALPAAVFTLASNPSIDLASAPACPAPTIAGATATVTCTDISGQQTWTPPSGITSATFAVYGAHGGNMFSGAGGAGGEALATLPVTPGSALTIVVGGAGFQGLPGGSGAGGFNGGANNGGGANNAGGGGGASDVRFPGSDLASRILVAGGGGGASNFSTGGGAGGGLTGTGGASAVPGAGYGTGGSPGTQSGGGAAGSSGTCCANGAAAAGSLGTGGAGGSASIGSGGGGGGGGYYGGGGAGNQSGGGGGSGFGPAGTTFSTGVQSGNGVVVITYTLLTASSLALTSSQNPSVFGQSTTFTATVSGAGGTPTGIVSFLDGGSSIGTGTLAGGVATLSTSSLAVASHTITASYGGDGNFSTTTGSLTGTPQVITKADTSMSGTASANPSVWGQSVTFTTTVSAVAPGAGAPTGTVTFLDGGSSIGTGTLTGGIATLSTSALAVGDHTITTSYAGDGDFNGSAGALTGNPQVVNLASTTTSVSSASPSAVGQAVTFTATTTVTAPGAGSLTGSFVFTNDGSAMTGCGTTAPGVGTCVITETSAGMHTIAATYSGDDNFAASTGSRTQSVDAALTSTVLTAVPTTGVVGGENVTFTATVNVTAPGTGTPAGLVTFADGSTALGSATLVAGGGGDQATYTTAFAAGAHSITATWAGDADFNNSTSAPVGFAVALGAATVTLTSSPNPAVAGETVTLRARVIPTAPSTQAPSGSVQFYDGTTLLGTVSLSAGSATFSTSFAAGSHNLSAMYSGNGAYPSAASPVLSDVEAVTAVSVPTTGANGSSIVQFGALLMLTGLAWSGAAIRRRRTSRRALR